MDFTIPDELIDLRERTERFVKEEILPRERDKRQTPHGPTEAFRHELVALARGAGLLSPHVASEWGGLGLDHRGKAVVFEAAGYAPLATIAMNIFAPDEANMHLLEQVADERQKEEWLRPLAAGAISSCFMMTEPAPGAGADPSMLLTTARRPAPPLPSSKPATPDLGSLPSGEGKIKFGGNEVPLFGGDLSAAPTQLELLRLDLKRVLPLTPRGTQTRIAAGLGLARSAFSNALAGRERFTATTAAVLRQWVNAAEANPASLPTIEEFLRRTNDAA